MTSTTALQENFLDRVTNAKVNVHVFLTSGVKLSGLIVGRDDHTISMTTDVVGETQLVYKHAIATILPGAARTISGSTNHGGRNTIRE